MKRIVCLLSVSCSFLLSAGAQAPEPLKVLVITGIHQFNTNAFHAMFDRFEGMACTVKEMGESPDALFENTDDFPYDAIVLYNFRQTISDPAKRNFRQLLEAGIGLTVMHHAIAGFPGWIEYEEIIGATYVLEEQTRDGKHYPRPKWKHGIDMTIEVADPEHPITQGVEDFVIHDETYKDWVYHDGNHLLLVTENEHSNREIAWTREHSGTRVFFIQLGHDQHAFESGPYRKLIRQGICWTADSSRRLFPADEGEPTKKGSSF